MTQVSTNVLDRIQASGLRLTEARRAIIATLTSLPLPATIQEIAQHTDVDTATVYRNVATLREAGVLEEIALTGSPARFAISHGHHHDHLTCTTCHTIVHIPCSLPKAVKPAHPTFAEITHHEVTYYGICKHCASSAS